MPTTRKTRDDLRGAYNDLNDGPDGFLDYFSAAGVLYITAIAVMIMSILPMTIIAAVLFVFSCGFLAFCIVYKYIVLAVQIVYGIFFAKDQFPAIGRGVDYMFCPPSFKKWCNRVDKTLRYPSRSPLRAMQVHPRSNGVCGYPMRQYPSDKLTKGVPSSPRCLYEELTNGLSPSPQCLSEKLTNEVPPPTRRSRRSSSSSDDDDDYIEIRYHVFDVTPECQVLKENGGADGFDPWSVHYALVGELAASRAIRRDREAVWCYNHPQGRNRK